MSRRNFTCSYRLNLLENGRFPSPYSDSYSLLFTAIMPTKWIQTTPIPKARQPTSSNDWRVDAMFEHLIPIFDALVAEKLQLFENFTGKFDTA